MRAFTAWLIIIIALFSFAASAQNASAWSDKGDSAYLAKNYPLAIRYYQQYMSASKNGFNNAAAYYNIACCHALNNDSTNAWNNLDSALASGYKGYGHILVDTDLQLLHSNKARWSNFFTLHEAANQKLKDPSKAALVTSDIHHFWEAYDVVQKDTAKAAAVFDELYFKKASAGLQDYYSLRIFSTEAFVANQKKKRNFYKAIRNNTLRVDEFKPQIKQSFVKLKDIYPQALFPDVYFLMGRWNSAGTVSANGLLIGTDMLSKTEDVPLEELNMWEINNYKSIDNLPYIVAHELIHYEQDHMAKDTTTLSASIREGMADFIGELISGKSSNPRLLAFAIGKEKKIWADFEKDMLLNRSQNWIANSGQERPDHPADLGYWIGYQICKSYYEEMPDKRKAVYDMLHIKNYKDFFIKSKYAERVTQLQ